MTGGDDRDGAGTVAVGADGLRALIGRPARIGAWHDFDRTALEGFDADTFHAPSHNYAGAAASQAAHGSQALAILLAQVDTVLPVSHVRRVLLYGVDRMRLPGPLVVGDRVRATFTVDDVVARGAGAFDGHLEAVLERDGEDRPACVARIVLRLVV